MTELSLSQGVMREPESLSMCADLSQYSAGNRHPHSASGTFVDGGCFVNWVGIQQIFPRAQRQCLESDIRVTSHRGAFVCKCHSQMDTSRYLISSVVLD